MERPESPAPPLSREARDRIARGFFFGVFLLLGWELLRVLAPFLPAFLGAAALVLLFQPVHAFVLRRVRGRESLAAVLSTLVVAVAFLIPLGVGVWLVVREAAALLPEAQARLQQAVAVQDGQLSLALPEPLQGWMNHVQDVLHRHGLDLQDLGVPALDQMRDWVTAAAGALVRDVLGAALSVAVLLVGTFFFFRDGETMLRFALSLVPMPAAHVHRIVARLDDTLVAVMRGALLTAVLQGLMAGLGYFLAGVPAAGVLGCATTLLAFVPVIGTATIWLPTGIWLMAQGRTGAGVFVLGWGILIVGLLDSLLRPYLIGNRARLPIFLLFFAILGGLKLYGPIGGLVGPLLLAAVLAFAAIHLELWRGSSGASPEADSGDAKR